MGRKSKVDDASQQKLTLTELSEHDDVCSDVMIDNAYYKSKIRKYRPKHIPVRGIKEDEVPQILLHKVIVGKDVIAAEKELLKLQGLRRYLSTVRSKIERERFLDHLRKYIYMYQTDCPWEVSSTNRYTITTYEAAVTARRRIKQGETIKYLTGTLVPLSSEESMDLDLTNRNFSIVLAGRKKSDQMFLGPARFANHDCDANGRLMMKGTQSMTVMAVKNINVGDEITVSYGDNYFGPDNVECLCHTCEVKERNGWTSKAAFTQPESGTTTPLPDMPTSTSLLSNKRKRESNSSSPAQGPLKRLKPITSPSKLQYSWTPPSTSESEIAQEEVEEIVVDQHGSPTGSSVKTDGEEVTPKRDGKGRFISKSESEPRTQRPRGRPSLQRRKSLPLSPPTTSASSQDSEGERARAVSEEIRFPVTIKIEAMEKTTIETDDPIADLINEKDSPVDVSSPEPATSDAEVTPKAEERHSTPQTEPEILPPPAPLAITVLSMTKVSTIASIEPVPDSIPGLRSLPTIIPSIEPAIATPAAPKIKSVTHASLSVVPVIDTIRVPGDYVLTRKLLAQPHDRWVRCHNDLCHAFFLQPNGYQTRRECPRCERHSVLYGFTWPKTDPDARKLLARAPEGGKRGRPKTATDGKPEPVTSKYTAYRRQGRCGKGTWVEGGGDEEERVMDHRTIHRFVLPEEERELTRKGLLVEAETARKLGEDSLEALKALDGKGKRELGREDSARSSEGFAREDSAAGGSTPAANAHGSSSTWSLLDDGEDDQGRRRSGRIVESRVYVNVCMKR